MKISLISTILIFGCIITSTAQQKTDWEILGLKGKIKTLNSTEYPMKEREGENLTRLYKYTFNNKGFKTEETMRDGTERQYTATYKYNAKNQLTEVAIRYTKSTSTRKYKYDSKNITINFHAPGGSIVSTEKQKLDANGNMIERTIENKKDKGKNEVVESYWFKYDDNNKLIEEKRLIGDVETKIESKYDEKGLKTEQTEYDAKGVPTHWYTYKYTENEDLSEQVVAYKMMDKTIYNYTFNYDNKGNWTEKREQINGITETLTLREVQYF